ncbi:hypothetical protein XbrCFBP1976_02220 [Xanthomonas bromi]|uniref:Uncharacterized protein n=1 Tax=Xanthomonas bromi TaxID=56449 RepID=A0ABX5BTU1_9XANT|nr:hypothetical protein XbrCFBP1976_02220 [Xanthomonas bromi]
MTPATRACIGRWVLRVVVVLAAVWGGLAIYYALTANALVRAGWVTSWCAMAFWRTLRLSDHLERPHPVRLR